MLVAQSLHPVAHKPRSAQLCRCTQLNAPLAEACSCNTCSLRFMVLAGNTFSDITEAIGLNAEAQTLAAGTISSGIAAQVYFLAWPQREEIMTSSSQATKRGCSICR